MSDEAIQALGAAIDQAQRIVCFTGAGISTESGIPDFRSPGTGLWTKMKPIQFQDFVASDAVRQESWARRFSGDKTHGKRNTQQRAFGTGTFGRNGQVHAYHYPEYRQPTPKLGCAR